MTDKTLSEMLDELEHTTIGTERYFELFYDIERLKNEQNNTELEARNN